VAPVKGVTALLNQTVDVAGCQGVHDDCGGDGEHRLLLQVHEPAAGIDVAARAAMSCLRAYPFVLVLSTPTSAYAHRDNGGGGRNSG
jgi:hypothetical protein